jgi:hypothetical protein
MTLQERRLPIIGGASGSGLGAAQTALKASADDTSAPRSIRAHGPTQREGNDA